METFFPEIFKTIAQQGPVFLLICAMSWYFYTELNKVKAKLAETEAQLLKYLKEDRVVLIDLVKETKDAVELNTRVWESSMSEFIRSPKKRAVKDV
jgi:hypothetical protein